MHTPKRQLFGLWSALLALMLVIAACGDQPSQPVTQDEETDATPTLVAETAGDEDVDAEVVTETLETAETTGITDIETVTGDDQTTQDVEVITGTQLITGTEVTTDVVVSTDTVIIEQQLITTVITATDLVTDVTTLTDQEVTTETELITDTSGLTTETAEDAPAGVVTDTEGVTDTQTFTTAATPQPGVAGVDALVLIFIGIEGAENRLMRASTLLDYDFQNIDGQVSGEIEDLLIDARTGQVLYATLEYGGFLDIGDTELPVPLSAFTWGPNDELILKFEEEALQNFPDLGQDWPDVNDPSWDDEVVNFWNSIGIDPGFNVSEASPSIVRASALLNNYGVGDIGYGNGVVQDMLVALAEGRVKYVLVAFADGAPFGEEWAAVPFSAFDPAGLADGAFRFAEGFDPVVLEQAPRFNAADIGETGLFEPGFEAEWDAFWNEAGYPVTEGATE